MIELSDNTALIVIDAQVGFDDPKWGERNNPQAEQNIAQLLKVWRETNRHVFHVRDVSLSVDPAGDLKPLPTEPVVQKRTGNAFVRTDLREQLLSDDISRLVVVGFTTDIGASTTARTAKNFGFDVLLASDGTAAFERTAPSGRRYSAEEVHEIHLASLQSEFATVLTS